MRRKRMRYGWNVHGFSQHPGWSRVTRLGVGLAAIGGISLVAGMLVAIVIADHSSSDSSPSSLIAIGLGSIGIILVVLGWCCSPPLPWCGSGDGPAGPRVADLPAGQRSGRPVPGIADARERSTRSRGL